MKQIMRRIATILLFVVGVSLVLSVAFWLVSIAKCEYYTTQYGKQFEHAYEGHAMIREPDYLKVLAYSDTDAQIYYVSPKVGGVVLAFTRSDDTHDWVFREWVAEWSSSGSADDFVWPYIR